MGPVVQLEEVERRFRQVVALRSLTLRVSSGDTYFLLGPNGSGKSTMLKLVTGVLRPTDGEVRVFDVDPYRHPDRISSSVGVAFEDHHLSRWATASGHLRFAARVRGLPAKVVDEVVDAFGLGPFWLRPTETYSAGMRKRVVLAQAWLGQPDLLVLDEPFSNLDAEGRRLLVALLRERTEGGQTTLVASHLAEPGITPTHIAFLLDGRLEAHGRVEDLADSYVARDLDLSVSDPSEAIRVLLSAGIRPLTVDEGRVVVRGDAEAIEMALATLRRESILAKPIGETYDLWAIYAAVLAGRLDGP